MRAIAILALALAIPVTAHADKVHDVIDALPLLGTIVQGHARIVVRGELDLAARQQALDTVNQVIADVDRRFTHAAKHDHPVTVCVMPGADQFLAVASQILPTVPSPFGFYQPDLRVAVANWGAAIGNLRHELVHPLINDDFPDIPTWLNEGIASLYGAARPTSHGFEFLVNYRLRDLQAALESGTLPTIAELARSTEADIHGPRNAVFYAMARYVLLYVDRQGKLGELYATLRGTPSKDHPAVLARYVDDHAFVAWARQLRL